MNQNNEQRAINAGEEQTPRLANKSYTTSTQVTLLGEPAMTITILEFDHEANSELWESDEYGVKKFLITQFQDPDGPSLESLVDAITTHIKSLMPGTQLISDEDIRVICEDISGNY